MCILCTFLFLYFFFFCFDLKCKENFPINVFFFFSFAYSLQRISLKINALKTHIMCASKCHNFKVLYGAAHECKCIDCKRHLISTDYLSKYRDSRGLMTMKKKHKLCRRRKFKMILGWQQIKCYEETLFQAINRLMNIDVHFNCSI